MEIRYAILGLLDWQPLSGYDLKKIIAESDLFYWSGNNNQIYNTLVDLHKSGLVSQEVQLQESLPARKVYSITLSGRDALRELARSAPQPPETRGHFLIHLAWADILSPAELGRLLEQYEEEISVQLRMHDRQAQKPALAPDRTPRERYLWEQVIARTRAALAAELDWIRQLQSELLGHGWIETS